MNQPTSTNTIRALCFKCNDRVPFLTILDDDITFLIECFCGNKQKILIHDYIKDYNDNPNRLCTYNNIAQYSTGKIEYYCSSCEQNFCEKNYKHFCGGDYDSKRYASKFEKYLSIEDLKKQVNKAKDFVTI